jgi:hypothetical protein
MHCSVWGFCPPTRFWCCGPPATCTCNVHTRGAHARHTARHGAPSRWVLVSGHGIDVTYSFPYMEVVGTARVPTRCAWTLQRASQLCVASVRCGTPGVAATRRQPPPHVGWAAARPPFEAQRRRALSGVLSDEPDEPDELCTFFSRCVYYLVGSEPIIVASLSADGGLHVSTQIHGTVVV